MSGFGPPIDYNDPAFEGDAPPLNERPSGECGLGREGVARVLREFGSAHRLASRSMPLSERKERVEATVEEYASDILSLIARSDGGSDRGGSSHSGLPPAPHPVGVSEPSAEAWRDAAWEWLSSDAVLAEGERWLTEDKALNHGDPYWPTASTVMSLLDAMFVADGPALAAPHPVEVGEGRQSPQSAAARGLRPAAPTGASPESALQLARSAIGQFRTDLKAAHEEICKLQGLDPTTHDWPEWSSPANTLRWLESTVEPAIRSALARIVGLQAIKDAGGVSGPVETPHGVAFVDFDNPEDRWVSSETARLAEEASETPPGASGVAAATSLPDASPLHREPDGEGGLREALEAFVGSARLEPKMGGGNTFSGFRQGDLKAAYELARAALASQPPETK